jgi:hypothetical protein
MPTPGPILLPTPRRVMIAAGMARVPETVRANARAWSLRADRPCDPEHARGWLAIDRADTRTRHPDGYRLTIRPWTAGASRWPAATIRAATTRGAANALRTLAQLCAQYPDAIPAMEIDDEPTFAVRGVMLDVSRTRIPTMESLRSAIDLFASLKINHLQLYTEHAFAYAGHEEVWRDASPITPDEARALDAHCRERGIELAANQNCFGHLSRWLRLPRYSPLAEIEGDNPWRFLEHPRRGPFSLCPVLPASAEFVRDLLGQICPCFASPLVNIGCDETFDVGFGRSAAAVAQRGGGEAGRVALYVEFVNRVCGIAHALGKRPMFWADIALTRPECLRDLPQDLIGLAWGYEPDADFDRWCGVLRAAGLEAWVCPGTSSWRSITGRTAERRENIARAAEQGAAAGASGFLITDWGDAGHHQQWPVALAGIAHGAAAAWNAGAARHFDARATSLHAFGDRARGVGPWLDELGDADLDLRRTCGVPRRAEPGVRNATAIFTDLHPPAEAPENWNAGQHGRYVRAGVDAFERVADRINELASRTPRIDDPLVRDEIAHTLSYARFAAEHGASWRRGAPPDRPERARLADQARALLAEHRRLWLLRSRPGGLEESSAPLRRVIDGLGQPPSRARAGG